MDLGRADEFSPVELPLGWVEQHRLRLGATQPAVRAYLLLECGYVACSRVHRAVDHEVAHVRQAVVPQAGAW